MNLDTSILSDEQLAGQRLILGFDGTTLNDDLMFVIDELKAGGVILFSRNIKNPQQVKDLCFSMQEFAKKCGQPALFISIDQEGGQVARLKKPFTEFQGNPYITTTDDALVFAETTASELKSIGVNMDMAPVLDIVPESINTSGIMFKRTFSHDINITSQLGCIIIDKLQEHGIMAVGKHFPGIGRTILDSHVYLPYLDIDSETLFSSDLVPFQASINHNVAGIMLSHILYTQIDDKFPASLSKIIAYNILREKMGFKGIVMTDDLDMGALKGFDIKTVLGCIIEADIDIALICHKNPNREIAFKAFKESFKNEKLRQKSLDAISRIFELKKAYLYINT
ncbi:MAG: glycoside hydrolase family 3 protein [Desulfobacterales bacterium]|nr:glycoside hydrolase family 3 protein [Desulfobacterales bacterium]